MDSAEVSGRSQYGFPIPSLVESLFDLSLWLNRLVCHPRILCTWAKQLPLEEGVCKVCVLPKNSREFERHGTFTGGDPYGLGFGSKLPQE